MRHTNLRTNCILSFFCIGSILITDASAAIVTVQWPCRLSSRVNTSVSNSPSRAVINGNVVADNQSSKNLFIKNYSGPVVGNEAVACFWPSVDGGATYSGWENEAEQVDNRYIELSVTPKKGEAINFTSLAMRLGAGGTGYLRANIYYSTDGFVTRTLVNACNLPILPQVSTGADMLMYSSVLNASVSSGQKLIIRIYPWFLRSSSSPKYFFIGDIVLSGNDASDIITVPQVSTTEVSGITSSTAVGGGNVIDNGGAAVIQRGICWGKYPNPTIGGMFGTSSGPGEGSFSSDITTLQGGTKYYVRAYATNAAGTGYGTQKEFSPASLLAFPGAEGFGKYTLGGRGGAVVEVTNLNDSGEGSLRYALENVKGPRSVVFRVSGTIDLKSQLTIKEPYVTIAGQTAPGDGICIKNYPLYILARQVIVRYIRCRLGDAVVGDNDAISLVGSQNLMLDHCSFSWSIDAVADFTDGTGQSTMQWCIVSEALSSLNHTKGGHSMGGSWDGLYGGSYHHNLIINCNSRVPRLDGALSPDMFGKETRDLVDVYNNVIYNWGNGLSYGGENTDVNYRNNYLKYGPSTRIDYRYTLFGPNQYCKMYVSGNYVTGAPGITADNSTGISMNGSAFEKLSDVLQKVPFGVVEGNIESATAAFDHVLKYTGAILPKRDAVDSRLINEVKSNGGKIVTSQSEVGGWPLLTGSTPLVDSDRDGMPDDWERARGLDPSDSSDRNEIDSVTGYTMLEMYLNGLCDSSFPTSVMQSEVNSPKRLSVSYVGTGEIILRYEISGKSSVKLQLYDLTGQNAAVLDEGYRGAGLYAIKLDQGQYFSSGMRIAVLEWQDENNICHRESVKIIR